MFAVLTSYHAVADRGLFVGWTMVASGISIALVLGVTVINLLYLLTQMVVATENCSVRTAMTRVGRFLTVEHRRIAAVFAVMLVVVGLATMASILATAGLGFIGFIPIVGLTVLPLQLAAWLARGLIFQYLGLTRAQRLREAVPRNARHALAWDARRPARSFPGARHELRRLSLACRWDDAGIGHPEDGHRDGARARPDLVRAGLPLAGHVPVGRVPRDHPRAARARARARRSSTARPVGSVRCSTLSARCSEGAGSRPTLDDLLITTGSQQGLDLVARVLLDPGDVALSNCRRTPAR